MNSVLYHSDTVGEAYKWSYYQPAWRVQQSLMYFGPLLILIEIRSYTLATFLRCGVLKLFRPDIQSNKRKTQTEQ